MKNILILCALIAVILSTESCKTVVVEKPSEPVVVVTRPPQPRPDYVWVDGDWYAVKGKYQYKQGYWTAPPKKNHVWVPGHWDKRKGGWFWVKGHWRKG